MQLGGSSANNFNSQLPHQVLFSQQHPSKHTSLADLQNRLKMPRISDYCQRCQAKMDNSCVRCPACLRATHLSCAGAFFSLQAPLTQCIYCQTLGLCWKCLTPTHQDQQNISCSLCWRTLHVKCFDMPTKLFNFSSSFLLVLYGKELAPMLVCQACLRFKRQEIANMVVLEQQRYYLVRIEHPSPCHYTWKSHSQIMCERSRTQPSLRVPIAPISCSIENIFGVSSLKEQSTLGQFLFYLRQAQGTIQADKRVKLLIKWRNSETLVWQDEVFVRLSPMALIKFLNQVQINNASILGGSQQASEVNRIIDIRLHTEKLLARIRFIGGTVGPDRAEKSTAVVMGRVYENYLKKANQSIKSKRAGDPVRAHVLGALLNTIYFFRKDVRPAVLFTRKTQISWWVNQLHSICPQHIVLDLSTSEQFIDYLWNNLPLRVSHGSKSLFWFNIVVIPYEAFMKITQIISLSKNIDSYALIVMDENMTESAGFFCEKSPVPVIKMARKISQFKSHKSYTNNTLSSLPSISSSKDKSLEFFQGVSQEKTGGKPTEWEERRNGGSQEIPEGVFEMSQAKQTNFSLIKHSLGWIKMDLDLKNSQTYQTEPQWLDNLERAVYLRYIMAFGMNFQSMEELANGLHYLERSFFAQGEQNKYIHALFNYTKEFIAILYGASNQQPTQQQQSYYLFDIPAHLIIKRIVLLKQLKMFFNKETKDTAIQPENHPQYLDFTICEAILHQGFGRWQSISQYTRVWEKGGKETSLREFICSRADLKGITSKMFCQFLRRRVGFIAEVLQSWISKGGEA